MELSVFSFKGTIQKNIITSNELFVPRNGSLIAKQKITSILKPKKTYVALKIKSAKKISIFVAWLTLSLSCQAHAMTLSMNGLRSFKTVYRGVKKLVSNNTTVGLYGELIDGTFYKFMFIVIQVFTCKDKNERIKV